ncbi:hypothetical protein KY284_004569 [Solanum tuberosum]|nr:hypothetical protein KY284_004569 [Solanum tuberosum]
MVGQENGILSSLDNEFPQSTSISNGGPISGHLIGQAQDTNHLGKKQSIQTIIKDHIGMVGQNSSESMFNIPQNFNEYMQGYGYSNEAITSKSLNSRKENEDGAPGQLQSNSWNTQDSHFNTTTNSLWGPFH